MKKRIVIISTTILSIFIIGTIIFMMLNINQDLSIFNSYSPQQVEESLNENNSFEIVKLNDNNINYLSKTYFDENASVNDSMHLNLTSSLKTISRFKTELPYICLTFDDCPLGDMDGIFDALEKYDMRATFFVNGTCISGNPGYLVKMIDKGHTIGNHTYNHFDLATLQPDEYEWEINRVDEMVYEKTGIHTTVMRPPFGSRKWNFILTKYTEVMWDLASEDSFVNDDKAYENAIQGSKGSIILFHTASIQAETIEKVCKYYYDNQLTSIPVEEMMALNYAEKYGIDKLNEMEYYIK